MKRVVALMASVFACAVLGACAQGGTVAVPAKPESTPTAPTATLGPTPGLVLLDISGSDSHQSNTFTAPNSWDIIWEAEAAPNTIGSFIAINVYDAKGNPVPFASTISAQLDPGTRKSAVVHMHHAGTVYLDIGGVSTWHIKAVTA
jgi:hypothetical protein